MVQRQAPNKLGIQADSKNYVKSEKLATGLKPSFSQHQDSRNKGGGTELKKKMKKSRSMKLTDLESLGLPTMSRAKAKSQLNSPPTAESGSAAIPQKSSPIKILEASPNYMKSTSSSNARKERQQVSPRSSQTSCEGKSQIQRNLHFKPTSASSSHKSSRTLTKTSSLKPVRTLTKTSSFKSARPSVKKCSEFALCPDLNLGRATCSSTLKDSKFPAYVMLHPGGTESEGTSVMKVCPYTYCSLNGHHHAPLPPLKCFLSARRHLLKTQKSMRLNCQSPKPSSRKKEIDKGQMAPNEDIAIREAVSDSSAISPPIEEVGTDFFIEIYAKPKEDSAESIGKSIHDGDDEGIIDSAGYSEILNDIMSSVRDGDETKLENDDTEVADSLPDESSYSEISFEDNLDQNSEISVTEMDITKAFPEDTDYLPSFVQTERGLVCCVPNALENRNPAEIELDESVSEATEMDWDEGQFAAPDFHNGADNSTHTDDESDLIDVCLPEFEDPRFLDELVFNLDDTVSNDSEKVTADGEVPQEVYDGKGASYNAQFGDEDSECDSLSQDQLSSTEDAFEKPEAITEEKDGHDGDAKSDDNDIINVVSPASAEYPLEELTAATEDKNEVNEAEIKFLQMYPLLGEDETNCTANVSYETLMDKQENGSPQDDSEINQGVSPEDPDVDAEVGAQLDELADEGCMLKGQTSESVESETDQDVATSVLGLEQVLPNADVGDAVEEKEQVDDANPLLEIQISESCQAFSETDQDTTMEDYDGSHQMIEVCQSDNIIADNKLGQEVVDESLPPETQDLSSAKQSKRSNIVENQDQDEGGKLNISSSIDSNEHSYSNRNKPSSAEDSIGEADKMQVENSSKLDAEETCLTASNITITKKEKIFVHVGSDSDQEPPKTCNSLNGTIRCRRSIKDRVEEEPRKFNPQEPHYLPLEPDPEAEKVDLRHQMMDERKNSEEWMLDYALRQAVTKLAPARRRRVALLVEAFETVTPIPKYETHLKRTTAAFGHARPIQACS